MGMVLRTFLIAIVLAIIIFVLGANNLFTIKDDFAIEMLFLAIYMYTLVIHSTHLSLAQQLPRMMHTDMQKVVPLNTL